MTINTFWTILLKVIGLFMVFEFIGLVAGTISTFFMFDLSRDLPSFILLLSIQSIVYILAILLIRLFLFRPAILIRVFRLESGFIEQRIDLSNSRNTVLSISIIVVGALLFLNSFPDFCFEIIGFFRSGRLLGEFAESKWLLFHGLKAAFGFLLVTNSETVLKFIRKKSENNNDKSSSL